MNLEKVPSNLHHLLALAEKWGISDDSEREIQIDNSSIQELENLTSLSEEDDNAINKWLTGEEMNKDIPSDEYVAFSCLIMSILYARLVLDDFRQSL